MGWIKTKKPSHTTVPLMVSTSYISCLILTLYIFVEVQDALFRLALEQLITIFLNIFYAVLACLAFVCAL